MPLNPSSIYGTSKVAADFLGKNYFEAYNLPVVVTIIFNNYGPRQDLKYIMRTVIKQVLEKHEVDLESLSQKEIFATSSTRLEVI